ncbi:MAG TPA: helix-turn-helix domain-containing protein [Acidimicrobiia bacterium]
MDEVLTLAEAGTRLGVSRRRVQAMVSSGVLPAEKRGAQWFVAASAVRTAMHTRDPHPGHPLSARSAWTQIGALTDTGARLAADDALDMVRRRLRSRARHLSCYVHPSLRAEFKMDARVVLGGREAALAAGAAVDPGDFDVYVKDSDAAGVLDSYGAVPAVVNPNVFFHVVSNEVWPFPTKQRIADPWVGWLDLEDRQDRGAVTLLDRLLGGRIRA